MDTLINMAMLSENLRLGNLQKSAGNQCGGLPLRIKKNRSPKLYE